VFLRAMGRPKAASGWAGSHEMRRNRVLLGASEPGASRVPMLGVSVVNSFRLNAERVLIEKIHRSSRNVRS
jgi:hypothetical protein